MTGGTVWCRYTVVKVLSLEFKGVKRKLCLFFFLFVAKSVLPFSKKKVKMLMSRLRDKEERIQLVLWSRMIPFSLVLFLLSLHSTIPSNGMNEHLQSSWTQINTAGGDSEL